MQRRLFVGVVDHFEAGAADQRGVALLDVVVQPGIQGRIGDDNLIGFGEEHTLIGAEQERLEEWIMAQVNEGASLPGLYPPNAENKARYAAWRKAQG